MLAKEKNDAALIATPSVKSVIDNAAADLKAAEEAVRMANVEADKAEMAAMEAQLAVEAARQVLKKAKRGEEVAINQVTRIVREELTKFAKRRRDAVKDFETSIIFIGEAAQPPPAAANNNKKKAPPAVIESPEEDKERRAYMGN